MTSNRPGWWRVTLTHKAGRVVVYHGRASDDLMASDAAIRALQDDHPGQDLDAWQVAVAFLGYLQPMFCGGPSDFRAEE